MYYAVFGGAYFIIAIIHERSGNVNAYLENFYNFILLKKLEIGFLQDSFCVSTTKSLKSSCFYRVEQQNDEKTNACC